jgi:acyl carrier protein
MRRIPYNKPDALAPIDPIDAQQLRARIEAILIKRFGRVEERLFATGLIDSLGAIQLGVHLEDEFGIGMTDLELHDFISITSIVEKLCALGVKPT